MKLNTSWAVMLAALGLAALSTWTPDTTNAASRFVIPAGAVLNVRLDEKISTEDARSGDTWSGTVTEDVYGNGGVAIPAGSPVRGLVTSSTHGTHNSRPRLDLAVRQITIDGRSYNVTAYTPTIVAGSKRAKKIGAIVGGAALGALAGRAVSGSKRGTAIGGILGGAAGYGLTRNALRTLQLKSGTVLQFRTRHEMIARRY